MKSRIGLIALSALVMLLLSCQSAELTAAKVYVQQENYPAALEQLKIAEKKEPTNANVFLMMGKLYAEMDSLDAMNRAFDTALELDSTLFNDIVAWRVEKREDYFKKGHDAGNKKKWDKAIEFTKTAVSVDPNFSDGWYNLGYFYQQSGDAENAEKAFRKAHEIEPLNEPLARQIAIYEYKDKNVEKAIEILKKIVDEKKKAEIETYTLLGQMYAINDQGETADSMFSLAEQIEPDNIDLLFNHGTVLYKPLERFDEAIEKFERVLELSPGNRDALYNLSISLFRAERYGEAAETAEKLVSNNPQDTLGWQQYFVCLTKMGEMDKGKAANDVAEAVSKMNDGQTQEAISKLEGVVDKFEKWCAPWAVLKIAYEEIGNTEGAERAQKGLDACGKKK